MAAAQSWSLRLSSPASLLSTRIVLARDCSFHFADFPVRIPPVVVTERDGPGHGTVRRRGKDARIFSTCGTGLIARLDGSADPSHNIVFPQFFVQTRIP